MGKELTIVIKTFKGLEEVLIEEIKSELGIDEVRRLTRGVKIQGDLKTVYLANMKLRTAVRVLVELHSFESESYDTYYEELLKFPWTDYINAKDTFVVDGVVHSEVFRNAQFLEFRTKDAIVDSFEKQGLKRPSVQKRHPKFRISAHVKENTCTVLLDSTGEPLFKRGYRQDTGDAPMNEVLAAGLLQIAKWNAEEALTDPMCGSGTLLIEAALKANNVYPGTLREFYSFKYWRDFDLSLYKKLRTELVDAKVDSNVALRGYDIDRSVLRISGSNAEAAGVKENIKFLRKDFFRNDGPEDGLIISNPPYGVRLEEGSTADFYTRIGEKLKASYMDRKVWFILFDREETSSIGLRPTAEHEMDNGGLECDFLCFELSEGSKKFKFQKR